MPVSRKALSFGEMMKKKVLVVQGECGIGVMKVGLIKKRRHINFQPL